MDGDGEICETGRCRGGDRGSSFGVLFEMPIRHPRGDTKEVFGNTVLDLTAPSGSHGMGSSRLPGPKPPQNQNVLPLSCH